jgi:hypothetical protein
MSKSISVTWSAGISEQESDILTRTVEQVLKHLYLRDPMALIDPPLYVRVYGNWIIPALVPSQSYWGCQWYVDSAYDDDLRRVIAPTYLQLMEHEPWQRMDPHFDLALLDQDLTDFPAAAARLVPERYTLGASFPGSVAVMSVYRLRALADEAVRNLALERLVRHHLGHALGIPGFGRHADVTRLGLETHCTGPCVMRHAGTVEELVALAMQEAESGWAYCPACTSDLRTEAVRQSRPWN